jgi:hypothetical protein
MQPLRKIHRYVAAQKHNEHEKTGLMCAESSPNSLVERVQDIYASVLESEECLERVACEVGGMVEDMGVNKSMFRYF